MDGGALPPFTPARTWTCTCPAAWCGSTRCAMTPKARPATASACCTSPSRGGSEAVHALAEGQVLNISAPRNQFPLAAEAKHQVLVAGGIGLTPLLCMAEQLAREGKEHAALRGA